MDYFVTINVQKLNVMWLFIFGVLLNNTVFHNTDSLKQYIRKFSIKQIGALLFKDRVDVIFIAGPVCVNWKVGALSHKWQHYYNYSLQKIQEV